MTLEPDDLGRRVRERREDLGLTVTDLWRKSGISRNSITDIEAGRRTNSLASTVLALESVLGPLRDRGPAPVRGADVDDYERLTSLIHACATVGIDPYPVMASTLMARGWIVLSPVADDDDERERLDR